MPKIKYKDFNFRWQTLQTIKQANAIIAEYVKQGFDLTLRQLYYQFVARGYIENSIKSYKNLGAIVNDGRLAGMIDWDSIVDRTRDIRELPHWDDPSDIVAACAKQFNIDLWEDQPYRPEVWIEKDALVGVFERICRELDVPLFSCRGYTSQSEMWTAAQRMLAHRKKIWSSGAIRKYQTPVIFHFGDHDPSGKDMSRDIFDRLEMFTGNAIEFHRLALNMDQVKKYNPPPNPAKLTDTRCSAYIAEFGDESWELDALEPTALADLVRAAIVGIIDDDRWQVKVNEQKAHRRMLQGVSDKWLEVTEFVFPPDGE